MVAMPARPDEGDELLSSLRAPDERTLIFNPLGIGGRLEPPSSALFLSRLLERATLRENVPENISQNFERIRLMFLHGVLEYEFFTAADDAAHLVLEGALRQRFVTFYGHHVPVIIDGAEDTAAAPTFDLFRRNVLALRANGQHLRLNEATPEALPLNMTQLWKWARRRRLLIVSAMLSCSR